MTIDDVSALSDRFSEALVAEDPAAAQACCSPDLTVWYSYEKQPRTLRDLMDRGAILHAGVDMDAVKVDHRRLMTEEGWVAQAKVTGESTLGERVEFDQCLVCRVADGVIVSIEEYCDRGDVEPLLRAGAARPSTDA